MNRHDDALGALDVVEFTIKGDVDASFIKFHMKGCRVGMREMLGM
jgi:hypothetical protein